MIRRLGIIFISQIYYIIFCFLTTLIVCKNILDAGLKILNIIFENNKIIPRQIMEVNNTESMIDFAKNGVGIACVIEEFIQDELDKKQLVKIPIKFKIPHYSVGYAYNKTNISKELSDFLTVINGGKVIESKSKKKK